MTFYIINWNEKNLFLHISHRSSYIEDLSNSLVRHVHVYERIISKRNKTMERRLENSIACFPSPSPISGSNWESSRTSRNPLMHRELKIAVAHIYHLRSRENFSHWQLPCVWEFDCTGIRIYFIHIHRKNIIILNIIILQYYNSHINPFFLCIFFYIFFFYIF